MYIYISHIYTHIYMLYAYFLTHLQVATYG